MSKWKSIEELENEVVEAEEAFAKNEEELEKAKDRLSKAEARYVGMPEKIEAAKEEFIRILDKNEDHKPARRKLKDLREEKETEEARIGGAQVTISALEALREPLKRGIRDARKAVLKEGTLRPLVEHYNELGQQMAPILERIETAMWEYSLTGTYPYERPVVTASRVLFHQEQGAVDFIPELSVDGESHPALYDREKVVSKLRQEYAKEDRAKSEKQMKEKIEEAARVREELEGTYKGALCLRCKYYMGVSLGSTHLTCDSFHGGIPLEILTGKVNHAFQKIEREPFLFQEKGEENQGE